MHDRLPCSAPPTAAAPKSATSPAAATETVATTAAARESVTTAATSGKSLEVAAAAVDCRHAGASSGGISARPAAMLNVGESIVGSP